MENGSEMGTPTPTIATDDGGKNAKRRSRPVPETGFTIWDASLLLAAYLRREEDGALFCQVGVRCGENERNRVRRTRRGDGRGDAAFVEAVETMMLSNRCKNAAGAFVVTDLGSLFTSVNVA